MIGFLATALPMLDKLLDRIPDPAAKERAKLEMQADLLNALVEESKGQAEINKVEAAHASLFVAGWRPAIGWACAIGFGWTFVGLPLFSWFFALINITTPLPVIDSSILMELTFGMLGMGALRTFEKVKGVKK